MPARKRSRKLPAPVSAQPAAYYLAATPAQVERLVERIFDETRLVPLIVMAYVNATNQPPVDPDELCRVVGANADVGVLPVDSTRTFGAVAGDEFRAFDGAIRLFWPGARPSDLKERHPLFMARDAGRVPVALERLVNDLTSRGYIDDEAPPPWHEDHAPSADQGAKVMRLRKDLAAALAREAALVTEVTELKKANRGLADKVDQLSQRLYRTNVYTDPCEQFRHEVEHAYLTTYTPHDRETYPMADYVLGDEFLSSVEALEGIDRDKIVSAVVDVVTRRAWQINGRAVHQLRDGTPGGAPAVVRADGATAWRCNLQTGTASARRLMWWDLPDGTIELSVVAVHDEIAIH